MRDAYRKEIIKAVVGDADPQTCVTIFDENVDLAEVLDELRTLPFLASARVAIIRDADAFVSANRQALEDYLNSPSETAALVLMVLSWPKTTRIFKLVDRIGRVFVCSAPQRGQLDRWLTNAAGKRGKELEREAVDLLGEFVGDNLSLLDSELEKLSLYVGDRKTITAGDVSAVVTATAGPAAFALTNAITAGNVRGALKALAGVLTINGQEFMTVGILAWHLRKALKAHQLKAAGQRPDSALRMPPAQKGAFMAMLAKRSLKSFQDDFKKLIRADMAMKSGSNPAGTLQELVVALCT